MRVANGEVVKSAGYCVVVKVKIRGNMFTPSLYVLKLGGCDVVLGVNWLVTLGSMVWNFANLSMKFIKNGREISLSGLHNL